ncbi:gp608 [Bacillus phage G]|uniref:Gp608 n=1 Tax=Bacillus phage G TaxID=2884420 RepID=G3MAY8_9CAUD|nr:gp608 [Bacillus phage G]AEO93853.1 gp608 [Bacillus phage G]
METIQNTEVVAMELLPKDAGYRDIAEKAKGLNIPYVGVPKDTLLEKVNQMITKINNGEAEMPVVEEYQDEVEENTTNETSGNGENQPRRRVTVAKAQKWFEEEGAFIFKEGDVVEIVSGKDLIGRKVQVKQPSTKKNAFKGYLIHPTTGELQKTFLSVDFDRVELRERDGKPVDENTEAEDKEVI